MRRASPSTKQNPSGGPSCSHALWCQCLQRKETKTVLLNRLTSTQAASNAPGSSVLLSGVTDSSTSILVSTLMMALGSHNFFIRIMSGNANSLKSNNFGKLSRNV